MFDRSVLVVEEVDVLLAERAENSARGPSFRIVHQGREVGVHCLPGEELAGCIFVYRSKEYQLRLSPTAGLLFDYLARARLAQTASQIARGIRSVKVLVERIRQALASAFAEAHAPFDPTEVLVADATIGNQKLYRLWGRIEWIHRVNVGS